MLRRIFPDEFVVLALVLAAAVITTGVGCEKESTWDEPGPAATFEKFLMDWYRGEYEVAFETITPEDRAVLTKPLAELEGKIDKKNMPAKADMLVVGRVDNPYDIKDIDLAEPLETAPEKGQEVTLELVYHDGREGEATMVWGGERWFVDLPVSQQADDSAEGDPKADDAKADDSNAGDPAEAKPADQNTEADGGSPHDQQQDQQQNQQPDHKQDAGRQQGEQQ